MHNFLHILYRIFRLHKATIRVATGIRQTSAKHTVTFIPTCNFFYYVRRLQLISVCKKNPVVFGENIPLCSVAM